MNILVIDRAPPCDLLQGNALIGQHLFRRLRHHHLTIICPAPASAHERYQSELAPLFDTIHLVAREQPIPSGARDVPECRGHGDKDSRAVGWLGRQ